METKNSKEPDAWPTILVAEDEDNDMLLLKRAFQKAGIRGSLKRVRDGEEAIEYVKGAARFGDRGRHPFPLMLLLDLKMPRKTGFEVLKWIRADKDLRRMIVVVLTSSREARDINRAYDLGANSYVVKPIELDDLIEVSKTLQKYWIETAECPECDSLQDGGLEGTRTPPAP
jgi:CheY-like chemotaxis protein